MNITIEKRIKDFWSWFTQNEETLKKALEQYLSIAEMKILMDYTPWMNKLGHQLRLIDSHIAFEFAAKAKDGMYELYLTSNGHVPTFPIIFSAVESKPNLKYFNVYALRQAEDKEAIGGLAIQGQGVKIDINETYFQYKENAVTNKVDFDFYIKGYNGNLDAYGNMLLLLLDRAIGEFNVATKVGEIDIKRLRYANVDQYISLMKIQEVMEEISGRKN